ncbi:hypothetical protein [Methanobrevibacter arboriphilus]|uniref:hypothetical protein n=1 Tax=Methanobrevibacter arboriphilus TaxID=39441 RepID=UPI000AA72287|nr:hypothetical protein [Methanobrevibacter arboriphilus]
MELEDVYRNISFKSFLIGAALFAFIVVLSVEYELDPLLIFSSAGLLYIGYGSQNRIQAIVLGALGTLPLFIATVFFSTPWPYYWRKYYFFLILISFFSYRCFLWFHWLLF